MTIKRPAMVARAATALKRRLDRRYALVDTVVRLTDEVADLRGEVAGLREAVSPICELGARFLGAEDPDELRRQMLEASRLAIHASNALESVLREEVKIWQALDAIQVAIRSDGS